jgi:DNA-binding LacI/PurR family transcriptional regulator
MTRKAKKPKYVQLADHLRERIHSGDLGIGDRLPSYAEMYREFGATTATVQRVYALLEQEKLIKRRRGSGVHVAETSQPTQKQTNTIGLLIHSHYWGNKDATPYLPSEAMLAGIRQACKESHKKVLLVDDHDAAHSSKTEGIIIYSDKLEAYSLGIPANLPQVLISQQAEDIASVKIDEFAGGKLAVTHLVQHGHRRIACLMEGVFDETLQRIAGYRAALLNAGVGIDESLIKETDKINITSTFGYLEWGRQQMREWLQSDWHQLDCTAIVVQNDQAAIGVMQVLHEEEIRVPEEVSIVGFDGTKVCDLVQPRLTSIQVPYYQIGYEAVKVLLVQMEHLAQQMEHPAQQITPATITLPVKLREGESVATVKKGANYENVSIG